MRNISVNDARPDMISANDIMTAHGQIIASRGAILSEGLIAKLRFYGIREITIVDDIQELEKPNVTESADTLERDASTYTNRIRLSPEFQEFQDSYANCINLVEQTFNDIKSENFSTIDFDYLITNLTGLTQKKTTLDLLNILHTREGNDSIYASNINVALISRGIGRWLKLPKEGLDTATLAGLFHDIGKISVPQEVLNKTGKLSAEEFDTMKKHTLFGQRLLKKIPGISQDIVDAAMQHHEKYDGTGYPMGLEGTEINPYAAIVAIADVYEAMTALRPHRKPLSPFQVIESFESDGLQKYNPQFILTFLNRIASAYQNRMVVLSDERKARIIYINPGKLSHPIVEFEDKSTLDLSRAEGISISEVI